MKNGLESVATIAELHALISAHRRLLVCFWRRGCPGCMAVSRLMPLLDDGPPLTGFDCTGRMEEAKAFGAPGAPFWALFENGALTAGIIPSGDRDALWDFLTRRCGFSLLRPLFELALDEGRAYAERTRDAMAELMFRSKDDGNGILSAARLKILQACAELEGDALALCLSEQTGRCESRLRERMAAPEGDTEARREALSRLPALRDELLRELSERKTRIISNQKE